MKSRSRTCPRMTGRKKYREGKQLFMIRNHIICHGEGNLIQFMVIWPFINHLIAGRSRRINSQTHKAVFSFQIYPNTAKQMRQHFPSANGQ